MKRRDYVTPIVLGILLAIFAYSCHTYYGRAVTVVPRAK